MSEPLDLDEQTEFLRTAGSGLRHDRLGEIYSLRTGWRGMFLASNVFGILDEDNHVIQRLVLHSGNRVSMALYVCSMLNGLSGAALTKEFRRTVAHLENEVPSSFVVKRAHEEGRTKECFTFYSSGRMVSFTPEDLCVRFGGETGGFEVAFGTNTADRIEGWFYDYMGGKGLPSITGATP